MPGIGWPSRLADRGFLIVAAAILGGLALAIWLIWSLERAAEIDRASSNLGPRLASVLLDGEIAAEDRANLRRFVPGAPFILPQGWQEETQSILVFGDREFALGLAREKARALPVAPARLVAQSWAQFVEQIGLALRQAIRFAEPARLIVRGENGARWEFDIPADWRDRPNPVALGLIGLAGLGIILIGARIAMTRLARPFARIAALESIDASQWGREIVAEEGVLEAASAARAINRVGAALAQVLEERTRFFAAISHDLQTPLTRLRLRLELIEDPALRQKAIRDLDEASAMIAATLDFLRHDSLREPVAIVAFASLIESVIADFADLGRPVTYEEAPPLHFDEQRSPFGGSGATLAFAHPRQLLIACRPDSLKRVFANLIENALAYGERAHVRIAADSEAIRVEVIDQGPGIPESEMERVFEPFYRLEGSRDRKTGGSGLGLAIVKSILDAHGGRIEMENRAQGGLLVRVVIPRHLQVGLGDSAHP